MNIRLSSVDFKSICLKRYKLIVCVFFRIEQSTEWFTQTAYEGLVCRVVSNCACQTELLTALLTHVDGPPCVGP